MARVEWLRTFVAVYRAGSVTEGASRRAISQPAASQQLAGLERSVGAPLFVRHVGGMEPTPRGRALYLEVADHLDRLEQTLAGLDAGSVPARPSPIRIGSTAEYFAFEVVPRIAGLDLEVTGRFGDDASLLDLLDRGALDVAVTNTTPSRRSLSGVPAGLKRFVLVGRPGTVPDPPLPSLDALGTWLTGRRWVAYSAELPATRRFWQTVLGRPFAGDLRLVVPDMRAVVAAVERGMGISLLPAFTCADALAAGRITEVHPVGDLVAAEPWFVSTRVGDQFRPHVGALVARLAEPLLPEAG